ncbi:hypothetical protein [Chitinophaga pinensis]|uniref:Uncharacterized protein n=1 Tax=Chitinophaga pinensis TaxID=79329 RepID=A0A5C6LPB6_9BACT|nr:hypothetical protein [Chitinophaga pinensis]TWV93038.1 hypothetical protein FEF09_27585 [Chitinophaga pinensis]
MEKTGRLLSLDVMRGLIMILLAGESCRVYESLHEWNEMPLSGNSFIIHGMGCVSGIWYSLHLC